MANLNSLSRPKKNATKAMRVGRGSRRGKTSGRGTKGQKARAGHSIRPQLRDIIKKIPKRRGYGKNRGRTVNSSRLVSITISLGRVNTAFAAGDAVNPKTLVEKKLVTARGGKAAKVVITGVGSLEKKLAVSGVRVTKSARSAIEAAGGTISE